MRRDQGVCGEGLISSHFYLFNLVTISLSRPSFGAIGAVLVASMVRRFSSPLTFPQYSHDLRDLLQGAGAHHIVQVRKPPYHIVRQRAFETTKRAQA